MQDGVINNGLSRQQRAGIVRYLVDTCYYAGKFSDTKRIYCNKKYSNRCNRNGNLWTDYVECPHDCPHHPGNNQIECDGAKCSEIKKRLKQVEQYIKEAENG